MENFVLYEEIGKFCKWLSYKGRKKGTLDYLAVNCVKKNERHYVTNQVRLIYQLEHRNIVRFFEWYETTNHLWMINELCAGGSLEAALALDGALPEAAAGGHGMQLLEGLHYLHSHDIIFGPLHPSKILVDIDGVLKLADFATSVVVGEDLAEVMASFGGLLEDGPSIELMGFMAPELLEGGRQSRGSDVWSLGVLLYRMGAGRLPFPSRDEAELKSQITGLAFSLPGSSLFWGLVGRCLQEESLRASTGTLREMMMTPLPPAVFSQEEWTVRPFIPRIWPGQPETDDPPPPDALAALAQLEGAALPEGMMEHLYAILSSGDLGRAMPPIVDLCLSLPEVRGDLLRLALEMVLLSPSSICQTLDTILDRAGDSVGDLLPLLGDLLFLALSRGMCPRLDVVERLARAGDVATIQILCNISVLPSSSTVITHQTLLFLWDRLGGDDYTAALTLARCSSTLPDAFLHFLGEIGPTHFGDAVVRGSPPLQRCLLIPAILHSTCFGKESTTALLGLARTECTLLRERVLLLATRLIEGDPAVIGTLCDLGLPPLPSTDCGRMLICQIVEQISLLLGRFGPGTTPPDHYILTALLACPTLRGAVLGDGLVDKLAETILQTSETHPEFVGDVVEVMSRERGLAVAHPPLLAALRGLMGSPTHRMGALRAISQVCATGEVLWDCRFWDEVAPFLMLPPPSPVMALQICRTAVESGLPGGLMGSRYLPALLAQLRECAPASHQLCMSYDILSRIYDHPEVSLEAMQSHDLLSLVIAKADQLASLVRRASSQEVGAVNANLDLVGAITRRLTSTIQRAMEAKREKRPNRGELVREAERFLQENIKLPGLIPFLLAMLCHCEADNRTLRLLVMISDLYVNGGVFIVREDCLECLRVVFGKVNPERQRSLLRVLKRQLTGIRDRREIGRVVGLLREAREASQDRTCFEEVIALLENCQ